MGGPSQSTLNQQQDITRQGQAISQEQLDLERQQVAQSGEDRAQRNALQAPAIDFNKALSSGDPAAIMKALAPSLAGFSQARNTAREGIFESLRPGAARDISLAQNDIGNANQIAGLRAQKVLEAPDKLANIGSGLGSFSLQELGAGISAGQTGISALGGASNSNQAVLSAQEQAKASTLGFLGNVVGAGAGLFSPFRGAKP